MDDNSARTGGVPDSGDELRTFIQQHTATATDTTFALNFGSDVLTFVGTDLTYQNGVPVTGAITEVTDTQGGATVFDVSGLSIHVSDVLDLLEHNPSPASIGEALSSGGLMEGGEHNDVLNFDGQAGHHEVHGRDGDDDITGGSGQDLINGNRGRDTVDGGVGGDDTLLGGQGDDLVRGHHGRLTMNGNLGDDTVQGGDGDDQLHGGQGNDLVSGGLGNDRLFGDLGDDTLSGGAGADTFHIGAAGGHDVITDFNAADGDRLVVNHAEQWTIDQSGADTVVTLAGGGSVTLIGVQATSLPDGWILHD